MKYITKVRYPIMLLAIFLMSISYCFATEVVTENKDIRVVVDGKETIYKDIPVINNGRTMLPLRELLSNLGVPDDDQHIIWNNSTKSITVLLDSKKLLLQIGSKTAYVNGDSVTLDVEPIIYEKNGRTYIPAKFVAQSLGKKVVWDGKTKSVYITSEEAYNTVNEILNNSYKAMIALKKYKSNTHTKIELQNDSYKESTEVTALHLINQKDRIALCSVESIRSLDDMEVKDNSVSYYSGDIGYYKSSSTSDIWRKFTVEGESERIGTFSFYQILEPNEAICSGLQIESNTVTNDYILKGSTIPNLLVKMAFEDSGMPISNVKRVSSKIVIDKDSYYIKEYYLEAEGISNIEGKMLFHVVTNLTNSSFNDDIEINKPEGLQ